VYKNLFFVLIISILLINLFQAHAIGKRGEQG